MRLIDADELKEVLHEYCIDGDNEIQYYYDLMGVDETIDNAPTIDPVKHGRWVYDGQSIEVMYKCSECGYTEFGYDHPIYCPNCGARMDGEICD